jgi:cytoskeletal protein RodZ
MLHNKQKMICHTLIIALTIVILGFSSYSSSVSVFPFQSAIHHHNKVFDKKQDSGSNSKDARSDGSGGRPSSSSDKMGNHLQISSSHSSDSSSTSSDSKSSDNTNNVDNANTNKNNNDQSTNDGSNTGADNNLHAVEPAKTGEQQQQSAGEKSPLIGTATSTPRFS